MWIQIFPVRRISGQARGLSLDITELTRCNSPHISETTDINEFTVGKFEQKISHFSDTGENRTFFHPDIAAIATRPARANLPAASTDR